MKIDAGALNKIQPSESLQQAREGRAPGKINRGPSFEDFMRGEQVKIGGQTEIASPLKFSQHAVERMHSRGISFKAGELNRIEAAVDKAVQKGSKETLVLSDDKALIVNTRSRTVVTVLDTQAMKENVFTNIDSTVLV